MRREGSLHRHVLLAAALLCLAACMAACIAGCASDSENPTQARAGTWHGETEFGSFSFTVCEGGRKITAYTLEYTTGGTTQALALGGGDEILIDKEGAFDLSTPEAGVIFRGLFSEDGKSASGAGRSPRPAATPCRRNGPSIGRGAACCARTWFARTIALPVYCASCATVPPFPVCYPAALACLPRAG